MAEAEMDDERDANVPPLSAGASEFVEDMGLLMEKYGMPRIGGRIMGLLILHDKPLSLDDIAGLLGVSRASVSTNVRMSEVSGFAARVSRPGDRRDYYVGTPDMWTQGVAASIRDMTQIADAARKALPHIAPTDSTARARLQETTDFADFLNEGLAQLMKDWQAYKKTMYGAGR